MFTICDAENAEKFFCENCDFKCNKKSNYNAHLLTRKHKMFTNTYIENAENADVKKYVCECGNKYKYRQSLHVHRKKCLPIEEKII
jgi:hypothetical protein